MAITAQRLQVEVTADTSKAEAGLKRVGDEGRKTPAWAGAAKAAVGAFVGAAVIGFGSKMVNASSDLNETLSKTGVVFGPQTDAVVGYAQDMADSFGLPKTAILDATSQFGLLGKAAGLTGAPLSGMSTGLAGLAADASSFYNVPLEQALGDFSSALSGESEPVKKYGVLMNETAVKAEAVALGIASVGDELTEGQKVQARASLITKGLADASGDLARTQESVSNQVREFRGRVVNLAASMGQALLPAVGAVLGALNGFITALPGIVTKVREWMAENATLVQGLQVAVGVVAAFAAGFVAVMAVQKVVQVIQSMRAAMLLLNAAMIANPIGLVVAGLAALATGVYLAYTRFEPFRTAVDAVIATFSGLIAKVRESFDTWGRQQGYMTGAAAVMARVSAAIVLVRDYISGLITRVQESFAAWGGWDRVLGIARAALAAVGAALVTARDFIASFIAKVQEYAASTQFQDALNSARDALQGLWDKVSGLIPTWDQFQAGIGVVWGWMQKLWSIIQENSTVLGVIAGVIALVIAPIPTLIALLIGAYTQFEGFRNVVNTVVAFIVGTVIPALVRLISGGIDLVVAAVTWMISTWRTVAPIIGAAISTVTGALSSFVGWLKGLWDQFWGRFGTPIKVAWTLVTSIIRTNLELALGIVRTALAAIGTIIRTGMAVAQQVFSVAWAVISGVVRTVMAVLGSLIRGGIGVIRNVVELGMNVLTGNWRGAWNSLKGIFSSAWSGIKGAISAGINGMMTLMRTIPGKAKSALGNIGGLLKNAGSLLMGGLANGIKNAIGKVTGAVSSVLSRVRGMLPGSPIKWGPLKDWNRGGAGKRLAGLVAQGLDAGRRDVAQAANRLAHAAAMDASGVARIDAQAGPVRSAVRAGASQSTLTPTTATGASRAAGATFQFTTYYPVAEPQSVTTNRALQRLATLDLA